MRNLVCVAAASWLIANSTTRATEPVDFNRDVRPILSDACFTCHGPDAAQRKADLRLDQQEGLFRKDSGVAIVDRETPEHSELLKRILSDDADIQMPPSAGGRRLTAAEKQTIQQWIAQGASWKGHWAYIPPQRPDVPEVQLSGAENPVDRFVHRQLEVRQLQPLPDADPTTLVRRLHFDLTGLPPSLDVVDAFRKDPSAAAWGQLTDQLLASHHYAERMTGLWLDQVRYADTNGIHGDNHREVWMYRDYVISAFHRNMPFDQFTVEQLAGDLLPNATDEQKIASGYNRLLMTTREGGAQPKEYLAKYSADRVRNASTVWLGATMGCCECHDHKFDPYSIRDFYEFAAFFADIQDVPVGVQPAVKMPSRAQKERIATLQNKANQLQQQLDTQTPELDAALSAWVADAGNQLAQTPRPWKPVTIVDMKSTGGQTLSLLSDGSIMTSGQHSRRDTCIVAFQTTGSVTGVRLETLRDEGFARKSLARPPGNGNFVLSQIHVMHVRGQDGNQQVLEIKDAVASFEQDKFPLKNALDGKDDTGWAVSGHEDPLKEPVAVLRFKTPVMLGDQDRLIVQLVQNNVDHHNIGRFRISTSVLEVPPLQDNVLGLPEQLVATITAGDGATAEHRTELAKYYRSIAPALNPVRQELLTVKKELEAIEREIPETLITRTQTPRQIRILARGDWMDESGDVVQPAVPAFLRNSDLQATSTHGQPSRLHLAQWFVDQENPLVARVFVNRLWKMFFGKGIVQSADDFGSQGSWPTHPELLDWLAVEFRESGWNVQHIIRLIVSSNAYRRSSMADAGLTEADPFNKWLARQSRFRLDAEYIRDASLAVSGLLIDRVGGRSVKPYQPAGYWAHLNFPKREWQADTGDNQYRRGLYTYWCRTFLHPAMRSFDAPTREECTVDRPRSNNSLQALVLLNDPSFVEVARALAQRVLREGGATAESRLEFLFRQCLSRPATAAEQAVLLELLQSQSQQFSESTDAAQKFLSVGQSKPSAELDSVQLAAWTSVARVVLNLHEAITRS